ncbi:MAG: DNA-directed RNA polymerase subunit N [Candidatus Altiarchaeota archaeon]|nr:DNA-directed RNA polymerase subunit N [Candidatus Altiarchaeota archaeon]
MLIPMRCFSCGFPVAAVYEEYKQKVAKGENSGKVLDKLNVQRYCCRRMMISNVDIIHEIAPFKR